LLHLSRQQIKAYAEQFHLTWVEDESNQNIAFSRNYLRHQIIPLLKERWPGVVSSLGRSAAHCQQAKNNLEHLAAMDGRAIGGYEDTLSLEPLKPLSYDRLANVLRGWLKSNQVRCPSTNSLNRLIYEVIEAPEDAMPMIEWDDHRVCRYQQILYLLKRTDGAPMLSLNTAWEEFPAPLLLAEASGGILTAILAETGLMVPPGAQVSVRYRQGGELFYWHGQTKQLKKLWQQWQVPPWQRDRVPLIYLDDDLAVVVGYAISDSYLGKKGAFVYHIEQQVRAP
jgi:tRNA(Ile)-lysidine synthase